MIRQRQRPVLSISPRESKKKPWSVTRFRAGMLKRLPEKNPASTSANVLDAAHKASAAHDNSADDDGHIRHGYSSNRVIGQGRWPGTRFSASASPDSACPPSSCPDRHWD